MMKVPNRLNYLLWLQDIVGACGLDEDEKVVGLDMCVFLSLTSFIYVLSPTDVRVTVELALQRYTLSLGVNTARCGRLSVQVCIFMRLFLNSFR